MNEEQGPIPNATITFSDSLPTGVEIIPTIYITEDCMHQRHQGLAAKLVCRIRQMNETNNLPPFGELQIDCDYTARSLQIYYEFLEDVKRELSLLAPHYSFTLSTTIRLHQLQMAAPPVDYGVKPYLRHLSGYPLPLCAAYPVYRWQRNIHGVRVEHTVEAGEILRVKEAVERERPELRQTILTYHLDKENINRYNPETYEKIYSH